MTDADANGDQADAAKGGSSTRQPTKATAALPSAGAPASSPPSSYHLWFPKSDSGEDPRGWPVSLPASAVAALSRHCPLPSDVFALVRKWVGQCRDQFCPPSSYSALTRSSYALVDASPCVGFAALTFLRHRDIFHRVVACEEKVEWADALLANAALYGRSDHVQLRREHAMRYFEAAYDHHSPLASMYWDPSLPSTPSMHLSASKADFDFDQPLLLPSPDAPPSEQRSFDSLSSCIRHLLSHPVHPVPLIILKLPVSFDKRRLCSLARYSAEERSIARKLGFTFLVLAGSSALPLPLPTASTASSSASAEKSTVKSSLSAPVHPSGDSSIPLASSRRQLHFLWSSQNTPQRDLCQRLKQVMNSQLWGCPQAQAALWRFFDERMRAASSSSSSRGDGAQADDEETYDALRRFYHQTLLQTAECAELRQRKKSQKGAEPGDGCGEDGRANSRVRELVALVRRYRFPAPLPAQPTSMLDVGCSEGSITASMAAALSIPPSAAHGCDVRELPTSSLFTFRLVTGSALPYSSSSMQLVLALMSLHHIDTVEETLTEIHRVLMPGGLLLVREHDLSFPPLSVLLDVMHGLYARVWSDPPEQPHFCHDYFARYRPRAGWQRLFEQVDLRQCEDSDDRMEQSWDRGVRPGRDGFIRNPFQFYYAAYAKPPAPKRQRAEEEPRAAHATELPNAKRSQVEEQPG